MSPRHQPRHRRGDDLASQAAFPQHRDAPAGTRQPRNITRELGLPHLVYPRGLGVEAICRLDHDIHRAGDRVVGLQQVVNCRFRHEVAPLVGEPHGQFPRAQLGLLQRRFDDLVMELGRDAVPYNHRP